MLIIKYMQKYNKIIICTEEQKQNITRHIQSVLKFIFPIFKNVNINIGLVKIFRTLYIL